MAKLQLSLSCGEYDITRGLLDGTVAPQSIEFLPLRLPSPERHWRLARDHEFDVCEFSLASYLVGREEGLPYTAIPVFVHRRFRHSYMFVNARAGIEQPQDLVGRRIGLRVWQNTASVWQRGILESAYGVPLESVQWFTQSEEDIPLELTNGLRVQRIPADANLDTLLLDGELDAALYPEVLPSITRGDGRVRRLFADPKAEEQAYFRRTGIFPIMHTVVVRDAVLQAHPWVAVTLVQAFQQAKERAYRQLENPRSVALAWVRDLLEEQRAVLGPDPWPYGFAPNQHTLDTFCDYGYRQGLTRRRFSVDELFVPATMREIPKVVE